MGGELISDWLGRFRGSAPAPAAVAPPASDSAGGQVHLSSIRVQSGPLAGRSLVVDETSANPLWRRIAAGEIEDELSEALKRIHSLENSVVWDVGAYVGYHTLLFALLVGVQGAVVAFEPNEHNASRLKLNLHVNPEFLGRVTIVSHALSDAERVETFVESTRVDEGQSSGSHIAGALLPEEPSSYESFTTRSVETTTVDVLVQGGWIPPDLIKVDVEGGEARVLRGAREVLLRNRPTLLLDVHHAIAMFHVLRELEAARYDVSLLEPSGEAGSRAFVLGTPR